MASPTEAEIQDIGRRIILLYEQSRLFGNVTATNNWVSMEDALIQAMESDFAAEMLAGLATSRSRLHGILTDVPAAMYWWLRTYARQQNWPETDAPSMFRRLYQRFVDATLRVETRNFTHGSVTAGGGNVGNGTVNRLPVDENNFTIEATHGDVKTLKCVRDRSSGAERHEEVFEIRGESAGRDALQVSGSGGVGEVKCVSARDSLLLNTSFSLFTGTIAVLTGLTNWTINTGTIGTDFALDETNYYRDSISDTTPRALILKTNTKISQALSVRGTQLNARVPYYLQVAYNRQVYSGDGTLTIRLGASTKAVALAAQTGWNVLRIDLGTANWFKVFNEQSLNIEIELTSNTTGDVLVDDVLFVPFQGFDGLWYCPVGGSTNFLRDDSFTFTDAEGLSTDGVIQRWMQRAFAGYLPSGTGGAITWSDP
jgi:hypothetical protein